MRPLLRISGVGYQTFIRSMYLPTTLKDLSPYRRASSCLSANSNCQQIDNNIFRAGTSQIVAADASGMAITITSTVNLLFG